ncbi:MAG: RNA-protein complex protein Nop10 [Candidatus Thermoplasmatota archaeon]|nr:RNA-protein complex protein Nop10 [Candidatus Thermoplasmatota archaeon]
MVHLLYCKNCNDYTLDENCHRCNNKSITKNPPRFSPQDNYGRYRRELKKSMKK